jgi:hypothetical protein
MCFNQKNIFLFISFVKYCNFQNLFTTFDVVSIKELSLSGNQELKDLQRLKWQTIRNSTNNSYVEYNMNKSQTIVDSMFCFNKCYYYVLQI